MRKTAIFITAALALASCDIRTQETKRHDWPTAKSLRDIVRENRRIQDSIEQTWHGTEVVTIDSCEYIRKELLGYKKAAYTLVHKGNCRFCAERRRQELRELIETLDSRPKRTESNRTAPVKRKHPKNRIPSNTAVPHFILFRNAR